MSRLHDRNQKNIEQWYFMLFHDHYQLDTKSFTLYFCDYQCGTESFTLNFCDYQLFLWLPVSCSIIYTSFLVQNHLLFIFVIML